MKKGDVVKVIGDTEGGDSSIGLIGIVKEIQNGSVELILSDDPNVLNDDDENYETLQVSEDQLELE